MNMNTSKLRAIDDVLVMIEKHANKIRYNIDEDKRYTELCELVTAIDMGEVEESAAGDKLIKRWLIELARCFYFDFDESSILFEALNKIA